MNGIFDIASRVATPLALAGFMGAVLFFILRQIIRAGIRSGVNRNEVAPVLLHIVNLLFVLCLVAMVLGFAGYVIQLQAASSHSSYSLPPSSPSPAPTPDTKTLAMSAVALIEQRRIWSQQVAAQKKKIKALEDILSGRVRVPYSPSRRSKPGGDPKAELKQSLEDAKHDLKVIEDNEPRLVSTDGATTSK